MHRILAVAALLALSSAAFGQATPEHLLPADCLVYFRYDGYAPHKKAYDQTALAQAMRDGLSDFFEHIFSQTLTLARDIAPGDNKEYLPAPQVKALLDSIGQHGFALAFRLEPPQANKDAWEADFQLTVVFPRAAESKFFRWAAGAPGATVKKVQRGKRTVFTFKNGDRRAAWWVEGEHVVATWGTKPLAKALAVIEGRQPNLTAAPWYRELAEFKRYESDMRGRVDLAGLMDRAGSLLNTDQGRGLEKLLDNLKNRFAQFVVMRHLGLTGLKDLTFVLGFDGKYQRSTVKLGVAEPEQRAGLLRLVSGPIAYGLDKLPALPPDADYVSVRHVDWNNVYEYVRTSFNLVSMSEWPRPGLPRFPDLNRELGIDFRKDFLDQLDTTIVTYGAHSEGPFFLGQGLAVKVKDTAKVRKSLAAITKALGKFDEMLAADHRTYRGQEMYVLSKLPLPVTFALHQDWLVIGLFPQPVQGFILRNGGKYRAWKKPPEADEVLAKERRDNGSGKLLAVTVSDPRPAVTMGLAALPALSQMLNQGLGIKGFDVSKIPNAQAVNEPLFPNVTLFYDDGKALRWENHYSINEPDHMILLPFALQFGAFLPDLLPSRPTLDRVEASLPKEPTLCSAKAVENDGEVRIRIEIVRRLPYTVMRQVPEKVTKMVVENGVTKEVTETVYKTLQETMTKEVLVRTSLQADGKKVQVSRKDGKTIEPRELLKLLEMETQVLLVPGGEIPADMLQNLDERTLIIRVMAVGNKEDPLLKSEKSKPANVAAPMVELPAPRPLQSALCQATAFEKDGKIQLRLVEKEIFETVEKVVVENGVKKVVKETVPRRVFETQMVPAVFLIIADGKKVQASRTDGKTVEPRELLKLLAKETLVVYVRGGEVPAEMLRKLDERTLIIRDRSGPQPTMPLP